MRAASLSVRGALMVTAAAFAGFVLLSASFAPDAAARMRCSYSGAPQGLLTVRADRGASGQITRNGRRIVVREFLERPSRCRGGVPTVRKTDIIRVFLRSEDDDVEVLLRGGPLAPGATRERVGTSEIEIRFRGSDAFAGVVGTRGADEFHWARGVGNHAGLNLNPGGGRDRDVDVTARGRDAFLTAEGGSGADTIVPAPGAPFPNQGVLADGGPGDDRLIAPPNRWGILNGAGGDDILVGGREGDIFQAGGGHDRLISDGGADSIRAGPGRDLIFSGPGRDRINSRDFNSDGVQRPQRDRVDCGTNRDRVMADRRDRLRGCEVIRRR